MGTNDVAENYPGDDEFKARYEAGEFDVPDEELLPELSELHEDVVKESQMREQEVEEVRDFGKMMAAYWMEMMRAQVPPPIAGALVREFQQGEIQRRLNLEVLRERLRNE